MDGGLNRRALAAAVLVAAAVAWFAATPLPWPGRVGVVLFLVFLPALTLLQADMLARADLTAAAGSRMSVYASSAAAIWAMGAVGLVLGLGAGFTPALLGLRWPGAGPAYGWAAIALAAGIAVLVVARLLGASETTLVDLVLPSTRAERWAFVGVSLSAGIGEELAFRSFLVPAIGAASGNVWIGAAVSSVAFGLVHSYQGATGVLRATLLGFVLALPLVLVGSVLPAMAAHAALDLVAGLWLADWLMHREGV